MVSNRYFDKLVWIVVTLALVAALILPGSTNSNASAKTYHTEYAEQLFGDEIITVEFQVDQDDWDEMITNAQAKTYIMADVVVNGVTYKDVGVRTKGNASLSQVSQSASPERYSLRVKFDEYIEGQTCLGLDELVLNNLIADPTYMKEYLSQDLMRFIGVESPLTNYASLSVNGAGIGFYVALESYGESYDRRVYGENTGNYYNVKTMEMGGGDRNIQPGGFAIDLQNNQGAIDPPQTEDWDDRQAFIGRGGGNPGGSLEYTDDDPDSYPAIFDNVLGKVTSSDKQNLIEALQALSTGQNIEAYFDVDEVLRYFAAHTFLVSMDSYYSNMAQNYTLLERDGVVSILPWDYHLSYGGFQSGSASDVVNAPIDTPLSGVTLESRPLLNAMLSNPDYLEHYHQYLNKIVTEYFNSGLFEETVLELQSKISPYVESDPTAYTSFAQFNQGVETLMTFNQLRAESVAGQLTGIIPSTSETQASDGSALVDASAITMSDLGSMGMGGDRGGFGGAGQGQEGMNPPTGMPDQANMPDQSVMRRAMEIVRAAGGELTDPVKAELLALGITEDQLSFFENFQDGFPGGGMPQNGQNPAGQTPPAMGQDQQTLTESTPVITTGGTTGFVSNATWLNAGLGLLLVIGIFFLTRFKRSY